MWETCREGQKKLQRPWADKGEEHSVWLCRVMPLDSSAPSLLTAHSPGQSGEQLLQIGAGLFTREFPTELECGGGKGWWCLSHGIIAAKSSLCLGKLGNCLVLLASANGINQQETGTSVPGPSVREKKLELKNGIKILQKSYPSLQRSFSNLLRCKICPHEDFGKNPPCFATCTQGSVKQIFVVNESSLQAAIKYDLELPLEMWPASIPWGFQSWGSHPVSPLLTSNSYSSPSLQNANLGVT